ncbi:hypothetical protein CEXT_2901 [Caerostris extrusa]|uniref:Uncharacterized protein n=1 Tax=Caerostris extrusa TaxID=172846 RepID=A0AAV4VGY8_CAEEX|nr:hypothetical protein CEXT_2901 [Caerostris extrusa]
MRPCCSSIFMMVSPPSLHSFSLEKHAPQEMRGRSRSRTGMECRLNKTFVADKFQTFNVATTQCGRILCQCTAMINQDDFQCTRCIWEGLSS